MALDAIPSPRLARALCYLPRGRALPADVWWQRHRGILALLWLHVPVLVALALSRGVGLVHGTLEAAVVASFAGLATAGRPHRRLSTVIASVGLLTSSAVLVHLSDGLIEMHFHYFVMVGVITLYQDWRPFLVAIGYVVLQHGVAGVISPESVYNHPEAVADPWTWAGVHGLFILGMSAAGIITWRLNESLLEAARDREHKLAEAQELAQIGSWEFDIDTGRLAWSAQMFRLYQVDPRVEPDRELVSALVHRDDLLEFDADIERCIADGTPLSLDYRVVLPDGSVRWMHRRGEVTGWADGRPVRMSGTLQDVTERRRSEDALRAHEAELRDTLSLLSATLDATADGILVVGLDGRITSFNRRFAQMWQIPDDVLNSRDDAAALGHVLSALVDPDGFLQKVRDLYAQPAAESHDTIQFLDGRVIERYSTPQRVSGDIVGRVWSFRDVTDRKRLEGELAHQAFHDSLTDLANQALFRDRVDHALARASATGGLLAVLFIDLDNFKNVNDSLGHLAGDELLIVTTARLRSCLRPVDTAARLGGDEFAVLVEDLIDGQEVTVLAAQLLDALRSPFEVAGREVFIGASIGVAIGSSELNSDQLLRNADLAMYRAKNGGRDRAELFAPEMHEAAIERLELEAALRRSIQNDELTLHYQPIVGIRQGGIVGLEALVRWQHPTRGLLGPDAFVPLAEDNGFVDALGRWVLGEACRQVRYWQLTNPGADALRLSVNLSPRQLRNARLVDDVMGALARSGLDPACLVLEITEGAVMSDTDSSLRQLAALKALGVGLSIDDFGTGYSSLSYLQRFPIDELKIDRSFVERIDQGPGESSVARAIVRLAQTLQLRSVAEGIETAAQLAVLDHLGCDHGQGFLLHRPQPPECIDALFTPVPARTGSALAAQ